MRLHRKPAEEPEREDDRLRIGVASRILQSGKNQRVLLCDATVSMSDSPISAHQVFLAAMC